MSHCENWLNRHKEICQQIDPNIPAGLTNVPAAVFSESELTECAFIVNFPFPRVHKVLSVTCCCWFRLCVFHRCHLTSLGHSGAALTEVSELMHSVFKGYCPKKHNNSRTTRWTKGETVGYIILHYKNYLHFWHLKCLKQFPFNNC